MSNNRPRMDRSNRAKQFMPFDALKGFREALAEKEKIIVPRKELSEEKKAEIDCNLHIIRPMDIVTVEYFKEGEYIQITGAVSKIDETGRVLQVVNQKVSFDDISDLQGGISATSDG